MCDYKILGTRNLLLSSDQWFSPGTPVFSTSETDISSSFHQLDMTLTVTEALRPKTNKTQITVIS